MKLRRCQEDREFTTADGQMWPMYINDGGMPFGFCPGKASWDYAAVRVFRMLVVCSETGSMYDNGGVSDQPDWFVDLLGWFLPRYNDLRFYSRAKSILGDGKASKPVGPQRTSSRAR